MSVEKYNPQMHYETIPYAQININVIQNITNMEAGFVWVYLQSKPKDWTIIKEHLKNHFKIGDDKIKKIFSFLSKSNLIEYIKEYDKKGKILKWDIKVLNGSKFISYPQAKSTGVKIHRVADHTCGSGALHIKENTKERKSRESTTRQKRSPLSDDFVFDEENQKICQEKNLDNKLVMDKFKAFIKASSKKSEDWQAEAKLWILRERHVNPANVKNEMRSNVMEYGPGHPTWEANQEWKRKHGSNMNGRNRTGSASL